ncbi:MAG: acyl-CoA dehydrogenase family protein [Verrucomicrobiales bacterium]|nr:acyl-CoA dehydrogenase family protein [Verrucomicrobiales bacterium]
MKNSSSLIDTSRMNVGQRAALEMAEAARDPGGSQPTFAGGLFLGETPFSQLFPFPEQSLEDRDQGDAFLSRLRDLLDREADPDEIDRTGEIPESLIDALRKIGAFGIKIPVACGGLGLSQTNYSRTAMELGSRCGNLTALLSAHQSIGVPQPLLVFGTAEQKATFLPRVAAGEISAFALTEVDAGSDPAKMRMTATHTEDGAAFLLNGEKLWCTNALKAGLLVVMARTPAENGPGKPTAFIVETSTPGVALVHRCRFMGLKALYNGVIRFTNVRVPRENILGGEGRGLKVALTTLNTGRITLPAACAGMARQCLDWALAWAKEREQWGQPIVRHEAIADKLARMAADTFALESLVLYVSSLVDRDKSADVRVEAAMAKLWGTERGWDIVNETMQIRGGRGYETSASLAARGEKPVPVERFLRDARINTIFEGSSEIMRLFLAREALDPHLKIGAAAVNTTLPKSVRLKSALRAGLHYLGWYPKKWLPAIGGIPSGLPAALRSHLRAVQRLSRRLARRLFHAMVRFGPRLERRQLLLGRFVDIGTELFVMTLVCSRAASLHDPASLLRANQFCRRSRLKIDRLFRELRRNADAETSALARQL